MQVLLGLKLRLKQLLVNPLCWLSWSITFSHASLLPFPLFPLPLFPLLPPPPSPPPHLPCLQVLLKLRPERQLVKPLILPDCCGGHHGSLVLCHILLLLLLLLTSPLLPHTPPIQVQQEGLKQRQTLVNLLPASSP